MLARLLLITVNVQPQPAELEESFRALSALVRVEADTRSHLGEMVRRLDAAMMAHAEFGVPAAVAVAVAAQTRASDAFDAADAFDDRSFSDLVRPLDGTVEDAALSFSRWLQLVGTSYVERNNGTIRQQLRRFTCKTLAFSKKLRNLRTAVALYVAWYDFVRPHGALHAMTPAIALGVAETFWPIERLLP